MITAEIYPLYSGGFTAIDGTQWSVDIEQVGEAVKGNHFSGLTFPSDTPAQIEWPETDKLECICPSALTLTLESDTDRRFIDLYSTHPGMIRAAIRRNGALYWCGLLDTELYDEPYSYGSGYDVTFTLSDLGQLKRLRWNRSDAHITLRAAIEWCLRPLRREDSVPVEYFVATESVVYDDDDEPSYAGILDGVLVDADRFYNEDGEAFTLYDTLEALLRPFGLRIEQRAGAFHVYDLHSLHSLGGRRQIEWDGTDAMLSVEKVYNNVRVTFSPAAGAELIDCRIDPADVELSPDGFGSDSVPVEPHLDAGGFNLPGFHIYWGDPTEPPEAFELLDGTKLFKIEAAYSGSDTAGAIYAYNARPTVAVHDSFKGGNRVLATKPVYIPDLSRGGSRGRNSSPYALHVSLDLLCDVCANPFERGVESEKDIVERFDKRVPFALVPVRLSLLSAPSGGFELYRYDNEAVARCPALPDDSYTAGATGWRSTLDGRTYGFYMFLSYYDSSDRQKKSGLGGWTTNRKPVGMYTGKLPTAFDRVGTGCIIPVPPCAGWLQLEVWGGVYRCTGDIVQDLNLGGKSVTTLEYIDRDGKDTPLRWLLYKDAKVELCSRYGQALEDNATDDVEFSAWLLRDAEEELSIETKIGSCVDGLAIAKGMCMDARTKEPLSVFRRAGVTDHAEKLLIGTAYSQHARRHAVLTGTTLIAPALSTFTDAASPGILFMRKGAVERLREAEAQSTFCELSPEYYEGIEYEQ